MSEITRGGGGRSAAVGSSGEVARWERSRREVADFSGRGSVLATADRPRGARAVFTRRGAGQRSSREVTDVSGPRSAVAAADRASLRRTGGAELGLSSRIRSSSGVAPPIAGTVVERDPALDPPLPSS